MGKGLFLAFLSCTGEHWVWVPGCNAVVSPNSKRQEPRMCCKPDPSLFPWCSAPCSASLQTCHGTFPCLYLPGSLCCLYFYNKSCIYWWRERGGVCDVDVCLLFPQPLSLKLSDVACTTWCKCIHGISQSCQLLSGLQLSCLGPGSVSRYIPRYPVISQYLTIFRQWWQSNIWFSCFWNYEGFLRL